MKKKDRELLENDLVKRLGRLQRFAAHFAMEGPAVDYKLPEDQDITELRRKATRLRDGAILSDDPSEGRHGLAWKIERAVEQHLLDHTLAAEFESHQALAEMITQKAARERERRDRAAFHRLKVSPEADDPQSEAAEKLRRMSRQRRKELGRAGRKRHEARTKLPKGPRLRVPLRFVVGNERHVFFEPMATAVWRSFAWFFPFQIRRANDAEVWRSAEVEWYGWKELQYLVSAVMGPTVPHLRCTNGWRGVYLPIETDPLFLMKIGGDPMPLEVGALRNLVVELERFGKKVRLPIDDEGLEKLPEQADPDEIAPLAYAQLLRAAHYAQKTQLPLWVVR